MNSYEEGFGDGYSQCDGKLTPQLDQAEQKISTLEGELQAAKEELAKVNKFRERLAAKHHQLRDEASEYRAAVFHLREQNSTLEGIIQKQKGALERCRVFANTISFINRNLVGDHVLLEIDGALTLSPSTFASRFVEESVARKLAEALEIAINTVECASIDLKTGEELPWYKSAKKALKYFSSASQQPEGAGKE